MNVRARAACALLAIVTLGAAPAVKPHYGPVPENVQTATVRKYLDALRAGRYDDAFALLVDGERRYFGNAAAFRSVFLADDYALRSAKLIGADGDNRARVYLVREHITYVDHATDKRRDGDFPVPIGVLHEHGVPHVKDPGKPYRAFATTSSVDASQLRVTVKKVDFFENHIDVIVTFTNVGDNFVTVLPYNKSVLRDDRGGIYRIIAIKNWNLTDKRLFEGVPLAPNARYTGSLAFTASRLDEQKRSWSLTVAPALREGGDVPFEVTVPIAPRRDAGG